MHLIATKSFKYPRGSRYRTRHLTAGDRFEAQSEFDAKVLIQGKKARRVGSGEQVVTLAGQDIDRLRAQATRLGIKVDNRWGVNRLTSEIQAKRG